MRVMLCGRGYLGKGLHDYFCQQGHHVSFSPPGLTRYHSFKEGASIARTLVSREEPDLFINASGPSSVMDSWHDRFTYEVEPALVVDNHARILPAACKYVLISSAAVYGETGPNGAATTAPLRPISPYGVGKVLAEQRAIELASVGDLGRELLIVRPFSVYSLALRRRVLWDIARKCRSGKNFVMDGSGDESRDFILLSELCATVGRSAGHEGRDVVQVLNGGTGVPTTIAQVVGIALEALSTQFRRRPNVLFGGSQRLGDPKHLVASPHLPKDQVEFTKPLDGLKAYFRWAFANTD